MIASVSPCNPGDPRRTATTRLESCELKDELHHSAGNCHRAGDRTSCWSERPTGARPLRHQMEQIPHNSHDSSHAVVVGVFGSFGISGSPARVSRRKSASRERFPKFLEDPQKKEAEQCARRDREVRDRDARGSLEATHSATTTVFRVKMLPSPCRRASSEYVATRSGTPRNPAPILPRRTESLGAQS
ncbi:MAG: hypothetical protein JWL61_5212 [Gemmatimonadetes bacterium]|nr:hypothetical protein [Gemmatimonadota bacterium]